MVKNKGGRTALFDKKRKPHKVYFNDEEWLKTTMAYYDPKTNAPRFEYEDVDTSLIKPRKRDYTTANK